MKHSIKKTHLLIAILTTTLFSTLAMAGVPKTVLVKAEPVNQAQFTDAAHDHLKTSLIPAKMIFTQQPTDTSIAEKKQTANKNKSITLANASLVAE